LVAGCFVAGCFVSAGLSVFSLEGSPFGAGNGLALSSGLGLSPGLLL